MSPRLLAAGLALAFVSTTVTGCYALAEPPEPTPTVLFATDEEAFAAAEATYRAYIDALNQVDLNDPKTFEAVYDWTTVEAYSDVRKSLTTMQADGWMVSGESVLTVAEPYEIRSPYESVQLATCVDVGAVTVTDPDGLSVVDADRPNVQSVMITVTESNQSPTGYLVSTTAGREGEPLCAVG